MKLEPKFAPYIDVTNSAEVAKLASYKSSLGLKSVSLAFALGGTAGCSPMWGGQVPIDNAAIINAVKTFGANLIVSTGGAMGPYLETSCTSASALQAAYQKVLNVTGTKHLDIDIEAAINADMMNQALAGLQKANPGVTVSFTLRYVSYKK